MFAIVTDKGLTLSEREQFWIDVPPDVVIRELHFVPEHGAPGRMENFDAYGFQRFTIMLPDGRGVARGAQLLGLRGDEVTVVEINEDTGHRLVTKMPVSDMTYDRELLRRGVSHVHRN